MLRQKERLLELDLVDDRPSGAEDLLRGSQRHLDVGRGGHHHRTLHAVVRKIGRCLAAKIGLPEELALWQRRSEDLPQQWMRARLSGLRRERMAFVSRPGFEDRRFVV